MSALLQDLSEALGGRIVEADNGGAIVLPGGGVIYANFRGEVKVQRFHLPVDRLGLMSDGTDRLAAAYHELTAVKSA